MSDRPRYSVVVPAYNRPERLRQCLDAIVAIDPPPGGFEAVVVDDGSRPEVVEQNRRSVAERSEQVPGGIRLIEQKNGGPADARNRGAIEARGERLAFTDDDCAPQPDWLLALDRAFDQSPTALLGGRLENALPDNHCADASQTITDFAYGWATDLGHGTGPGGAYLFATANLACPRDAFLDSGGFDATFPLAAGEDYDFCHHYQHAGRPGVFVPDAVVLHRHAMTVRQFCRQHFAYGRGLLQFRRRASARIGNAAQKNIGSFQRGLAGYCLKQLRRPGGIRRAMLVAMSQVATVAGALREWPRKIDGPTRVSLSAAEGA